MELSEARRDRLASVREGDARSGAVRRVEADRLVACVEGFGDVAISGDRIPAIHDGTVVIDPTIPPGDVRRAIGQAHVREEDGNEEDGNEGAGAGDAAP